LACLVRPRVEIPPKCPLLFEKPSWILFKAKPESAKPVIGHRKTFALILDKDRTSVLTAYLDSD
jgi:hypothetical protein